MRDWSPCASACSKAKAAKSAKLAANKQKEEKRKKKEAAKNQVASEPVAAFWRRVQDAANGQLSDRELNKLTNGASYYYTDIRHMLDGTFQATECSNGRVTYPRVDHFRQFCVDHQVSADALLDLPGAAQPEGQLTIAGWMPGGVTPTGPGVFAAVLDFGGSTLQQIIRWREGKWTFFKINEEVGVPVLWWLRLPPEPEREADHG